MISKKLNPKYGIISDPAKSKKYHQDRKMFVIINDNVHYAPDNSILSHRKWFIEKGWMTEEEDNLIDVVTRGYVDQSGVYFYKGYDFRTDQETETTMMKHLQKIVDELYIDKNLHLYGGKIKQKGVAGPWPNRIDYGSLDTLFQIFP